MIREIRIENYKSIQKLKLSLGRVTVFIGENGCGKSNILEAIALASAAANDKLDNEFLTSRGIRVTEPQFMRSAFEHRNITQEIKISLEANSQTSLSFALQNDNQPYSKWFANGRENYIHFKQLIGKNIQEYIQKDLQEYIDKNRQSIGKTMQRYIQKYLREYIDENLNDFLIYSPENILLRTFEKEGQIQPLGIKGEGLFKLLKVLNLDKNQNKIHEIKEKLKLIDWFQDFEMPHGLAEIEKNVQIKDKYLDSEIPDFDQRSSNEGFLFLMFYFALFVSDDTPNFFAIDNIDASLNPKLCSKLIKELVKMAEKYDKQAIFTTHNPAVLDGLNLDDDEQRLFVIYRNKLGHTKAKRILKPEPLEGQEPIKLSEAFMRGYIGGLPKGF